MMFFMKSCPECSTTYNDSVAFCTKDGKLLVEQSDGFSRLCPHCANSIPRDAKQCSYCKADLQPTDTAQWPRQDHAPAAENLLPSRQKLTWKSKVILVLGLTCFVLGVYLIGGYQGRQGSALRVTQQQLESRDARINELESQVEQFKKQVDESKSRGNELDSQVDELKKQVASGQKALATAQAQLAQANREISGLQNAARAAAAQPAPRPAVRRQEPPPAVSRTPAAAGTYETVRPTSVHEQPAVSARRVAEIGKGTRVAVIGGAGDWLEVRSKYGKPPGFIRRDDAMLVGRTN